MLTPKEALAVKNLIFIAEGYIDENGGCDHSVNICFCGVTSSIIDGYDILHSNGFGEHFFIKDFTWDKKGNIEHVLRCTKCYVEKSAT